MKRKGFKIVEHCKGERCQAFRCKNKKKAGTRLCHKHLKRREKETDPVGYAYRVTRQNARRRGKEWLISLEEWKQFCARTGYIEKKGRGPGGASIDRIDASRGYSLGNIRILSLRENGAKGATEDKAPF